MSRLCYGYEACLSQLDSVAQTNARSLFEGYETYSAIKDTKFRGKMVDMCENTDVKESAKIIALSTSSSPVAMTFPCLYC